jgi:hypothetical protein
VGIKITSKNRNTHKIHYKDRAMSIDEEDLTVYFYHWLHRIPSWCVSRKEAKNLNNIDFALREIWVQSSKRLFSEPHIIERLREGEIFKFNIEKFNIELSVKPNIPSYWRKYCISLCPVCKKGVNIHLSRPVKYCPICAQENKMDNQRLRRAIQQNRHLCKTCGKTLSKKYPNREYCNGACKQKDYRRRKDHKLNLKLIKEGILV